MLKKPKMSTSKMSTAFSSSFFSVLFVFLSAQLELFSTTYHTGATASPLLRPREQEDRDHNRHEYYSLPPHLVVPGEQSPLSSAPPGSKAETLARAAAAAARSSPGSKSRAFENPHSIISARRSSSHWQEHDFRDRTARSSSPTAPLVRHQALGGSTDINRERYSGSPLRRLIHPQMYHFLPGAGGGGAAAAAARVAASQQHHHRRPSASPSPHLVVNRAPLFFPGGAVVGPSATAAAAFPIGGRRSAPPPVIREGRAVLHSQRLYRTGDHDSGTGRGGRPERKEEQQQQHLLLPNVRCVPRTDNFHCSPDGRKEHQHKEHKEHNMHRKYKPTYSPTKRPPLPRNADSTKMFSCREKTVSCLRDKVFQRLAVVLGCSILLPFGLIKVLKENVEVERPQQFLIPTDCSGSFFNIAAPYGIKSGLPESVEQYLEQSGDFMAVQVAPVRLFDRTGRRGGSTTSSAAGHRSDDEQGKIPVLQVDDSEVKLVAPWNSKQGSINGEKNPIGISPFDVESNWKFLFGRIGSCGEGDSTLSSVGGQESSSTPQSTQAPAPSEHHFLELLHHDKKNHGSFRQVFTCARVQIREPRNFHEDAPSNDAGRYGSGEDENFEDNAYRVLIPVPIEDIWVPDVVEVPPPGEEEEGGQTQLQQTAPEHQQEEPSTVLSYEKVCRDFVPFHGQILEKLNEKLWNEHEAAAKQKKLEKDAEADGEVKAPGSAAAESREMKEAGAATATTASSSSTRSKTGRKTSATTPPSGEDVARTPGLHGLLHDPAEAVFMDDVNVVGLDEVVEVQKTTTATTPEQQSSAEDHDLSSFLRNVTDLAPIYVLPRMWGLRTQFCESDFPAAGAADITIDKAVTDKLGTWGWGEKRRSWKSNAATTTSAPLQKPFLQRSGRLSAAEGGTTVNVSKLSSGNAHAKSASGSSSSRTKSVELNFYKFTPNQPQVPGQPNPNPFNLRTSYFFCYNDYGTPHWRAHVPHSDYGSFAPSWFSDPGKGAWPPLSRQFLHSKNSESGQLDWKSVDDFGEEEGPEFRVVQQSGGRSG
ncbi:unnamed protein product [Amoebophrya sp. A120]|nr:unnamed protein product [Amoebophrya sp. A120]|eukprot:GSA120T00016128001.1